MIEIVEAYGWLNRFEPQKRFACPSVKQIVDEVNRAIDKGEYSLAWSLLEKLVPVCDACDGEMAHAEVRLEYAYAAYRMGNLREAVAWFKRAITKYRFHPHNLAVAQWMLGYTLLELQGYQDEAIILWTASREIFGSLANKRDSSARAAVWYQHQANEMAGALEFVGTNKQFQPWRKFPVVQPPALKK